MPAGINATSALDNVAFIAWLDDELLGRHDDIITTATRWRSRVAARFLGVAAEKA